jgi:hypothetical protein
MMEPVFDLSQDRVRLGRIYRKLGGGLPLKELIPSKL